MKYAVLIVSTHSHDLNRQTVVAPASAFIESSTGSLVWSRLTNGKQGRGNSWSAVDGDFKIENFEQVGDVVSIPITENDVEDFIVNGLPKVLFQKLLRTHSLRPQTKSTADISETFEFIKKLAETDHDRLSAYFTDFRGLRKEEVKPPTPTIIIERAQPMSDSPIGFVNGDSVAGYIERTFGGGVKETQMYDFALAHHLNVLIEGDAGTGKTSSVMNYAHKRSMPFYSISSNMAIEPTQLFGTYVPDGAGGFKWQDGAVTAIVRNGGVLLINEGNFLPARVATVLYSLLDYRRQITLMDKNNEVIDAHPALLIVTDMNAGYRGTSLLNEAYADRFAIKIRYEYDKSIEKKILTSSTLLDLAGSMRTASKGRETYAPSSGELVAFETPISTRILKTFELLAKELSFEFAKEVMVNNFSEDERASVKMLIESNEFNLRADLGLSEIEIVTDLGVEA